MYNVSNGMLKVGQVVQYKACVLSLKTVEIFRICGRGGGAGKWFSLWTDFSSYRRPICLCFYIIRFVFPLAFEIVLLQKRKLRKKWKVKTMARLFFIILIHSNIFRDFLGCRGSILISETVSLSIGFPMLYSQLFYCKNSQRNTVAKKKRKMMVQLFFIFWIHSNKFRNFSGVVRVGHSFFSKERSVLCVLFRSL